MRDSQLVAQIVDLIPRVCDENDPNVTMDTLEGVCYLLQRMQVRKVHSACCSLMAAKA